MSLKTKLKAKRHLVDRAVANIEDVLTQVVSNASKNTTGAQAMRSNISTLKNDLDVLYEMQAEFAKDDEADAKAVKASKTPAAKAVKEDQPEKEADVSEAKEG